MKRTILHVDLNSFFAQAEQQSNPYLRNKPIGIIKSLGRSCIIASSDEAKAAGLTTGMPVFKAQKLCPNLILIPADFPKYSTITFQFIDLCSRYTDQMEVFSLDEVFLDVTQTHHLFGGPILLAYDLQQRLNREIGEYLACSIGIAHNKLLAKMACSLARRKGVLAVTQKNLQHILQKADFTDVCGIGPRLTKRLCLMGITSLPQINAVSDKLLLAEFGPFWTKELKRLAKGKDNSPLITVDKLPDAKSVSRTYTLFKNTRDPKTIKALIRNLVEETCWKLRQMGLAGRQFGLAVRGQHHSQYKQITYKTFTDDGQVVFEHLFRLFNQLKWPYALRFAGVRIGLLKRKGHLTLPLFEKDQVKSRLLKTIDKLNSIYGHHALFPGNMLGNQIIRPEINGYLGDKKFIFSSNKN